MRVLLLLLTIVVTTQLTAQINRIDADGKRHGIWKKKYRNGNTRYLGKFNHGKEVGVFKYYSLANPKVPVIIKKFNDIDTTAFSQFFSTSEKLLSEGKMQGKMRIGRWVYYHSDAVTIMQEEYYVKGKLEGKYATYFQNKKPTILANYKNGFLQGSYKRYSVKGKIYQDLHYKNGKLDGLATYYNRLTGLITKKGSYINDIKTGIWEFYYEGELNDTKDYSPRKRQ